LALPLVLPDLARPPAGKEGRAGFQERAACFGLLRHRWRASLQAGLAFLLGWLTSTILATH
jgi:hypothetical protein